MTGFPHEVVWWALRCLGVDEWIVSVIKAMYEDATTTVRVNGRESKAFSVRVGVHQGSVLSPLLFIIVLEALSREGLPMELLYADDLVLVAETEELLMEKLRNITLHYITSFHTPITPTVTNDASTKSLKFSECELKKVSFQKFFEGIGVCEFLEIGRKRIPCLRSRERETPLAEL